MKGLVRFDSEIHQAGDLVHAHLPEPFDRQRHPVHGANQPVRRKVPLTGGPDG
jgi:hypothetical protein